MPGTTHISVLERAAANALAGSHTILVVTFVGCRLSKHLGGPKGTVLKQDESWSRDSLSACSSRFQNPGNGLSNPALNRLFHTPSRLRCLYTWRKANFCLD